MAEQCECQMCVEIRRHKALARKQPDLKSENARLLADLEAMRADVKYLREQHAGHIQANGRLHDTVSDKDAELDRLRKERDTHAENAATRWNRIMDLEVELDRLRNDNEQIREHANKLGKRIAELQQESDEQVFLLRRLRIALEDAPHGKECLLLLTGHWTAPSTCSCWKSRALNPKPTPAPQVDKQKES